MSAKVRWVFCSAPSTARRSARTPPISTRAVRSSNGTPKTLRERETSASGAPAATRAAKVMSPAAPPTGWKWTWTGVLVLVPPATGHLAGHQEGDGEEYG